MMEHKIFQIIERILEIYEVAIMNIIELLPQLRKLKRADKLYIMQFLVSELAQEESDLLRPDFSYPVWSPYDATEAANKMLRVLRKSEEKHDA